jgi:UDP-N-acetylmuramate--alanine ligase
MRLKTSRFHFVGIGGIGMCGLAELLKNMGAQVTGSDLAENANTERLKGLGIPIFRGHSAENIGDAEVVVYSSAINFQNPEIAAARARLIPLIPRAEALAEIMRFKRGIAVAGTHGKTTTTSMVASIFLEAQASPTIVVGGRFERIQSTALLGQGEWLVAEADESDGSFAKLAPEIAIITNIDADHLDYYKTFENLEKAFFDFSLKIPFYGELIACGDDPSIRETFQQFPKRILLYGFRPENDVVIRGEKGRYELYKHGLRLGEFTLGIPGIHNALNGTAAILAGMVAGFDFDTCARGLAQFSGVDRRFHFKGEGRGVKVFDDYGHHPTEVRAVLQAFKEKYPENKLTVLFQPHRFSRTQHCWNDFVNCFGLADELLLLDIYPAGEMPIPGVSSQKLVEEIKHPHCRHFVRSSEAAKELVVSAQSGQIFLTLGAGDGWKFGMELLKLLQSC